MGLNDLLFDRAVRHAVFLERLRVGEAAKIQRFLERELYPDLAALVEKRMAGIASRGFDTGPWTTKRLRAMFGSTDKLIKGGTLAAQKRLTPLLHKLAKAETKTLIGSLKATTPIDLGFRSPDVATLRGIVGSQPFLGKLYREHWGDLTRSAQGRVRQAVSVGIAQGESVKQIVSRVRATTPLTSRHAETLVRTSVSHVSTQAREITYRENGDVIGGVRYVATLDARTTDICASLDGREFKIGEGERPPMHMNCRSTTVPITKSFEELGLGGKFKEVPPSTRASIDGQVPAKQSYGTWLSKQPRSVQNEVLGKGKAELFRQGRLGPPRSAMRRLVNQNNRPLTLRELVEKEDLLDFDASVAGLTDTQKLEQIGKLLDDLKAATDPKLKRSIRGKLRRLGHKGGTKGVAPKPKPKPSEFTPQQKKIIELLDELATKPPKARATKIRQELRKLGHKGGLKSPRPVPGGGTAAPPPAIPRRLKLDPPPSKPPSLTAPPSKRVAYVSDETQRFIDAVRAAKTPDEVSRIIRSHPSSRASAISFRGADIRAAQDIAQAWLEVADAFPQQAMEELVHLKVKKLRKDSWYAVHSRSLRGLARKQRLNQQLEFNDRWFGDKHMGHGAHQTKTVYDKYLSSKARNARTGWSSGPGGLDTARHELGHFIDFNPVFNTAAARKVLLDAGSSAWRRNLSQYAATNDREAFAEAFNLLFRTANQPDKRNPLLQEFAAALAKDFEVAGVPVPKFVTGI